MCAIEVTVLFADITAFAARTRDLSPAATCRRPEPCSLASAWLLPEPGQFR
jgi:hypothetical protein